MTDETKTSHRMISRKSPAISDSELYKLSKKELKEYIKKERRTDEIDRLRDIRRQKRTWNKIFFACLFMNILYIVFAFLGGTDFG